MRQLVWCLTGLALLCAACGDDDPVKDTNQNEENWVFCETKSNQTFLSRDEQVVELFMQECDAINGSLTLQGNITSLVGLEKIRAIKGNLWIIGTSELTDLSPLKNLEEVQGLDISQNEKLDNCQATALAAQLKISAGKFINDNKGDAICSTWPQ